MHPRYSLPALTVMLALASVALATDHPIAGDSLLLKDPMSVAGRKVRFKATRDAAIDPSQAGDPRALGATLEMAGTSPGDGTTGPITLDPCCGRASAGRRAVVATGTSTAAGRPA